MQQGNFGFPLLGDNSMRFADRLGNSALATAMLNDVHSGFKGHHMPHADTNGFCALKRGYQCTDHFAFMNKKNVSANHLGLSDKPSLRHAYHRFIQRDAEVARQAASIGMCLSVTIDKENVRLHLEFSDAGYSSW